MVESNKIVFDELVKKGCAKNKETNVWDISNRKLLYLTPELSKGFLNLRNFDIYKEQVIDREINLIKKHASKIAKDIGDKPFNLIDVYCGDGKKACEFIKALGSDTKIRYCPININKYLVDLAVENIKAEGFENVVEFSPIISSGNWHVLKDVAENLKDENFGRNVSLILGSVLGSYEINDYLFEFSENMSEEDYLIIGNAIRSGERLVNLQTYKHPIWNKWFIHLIKELGLKEEEVGYDARYTDFRGEGFYKLKVDKTIESEGKKVKLKKGDEILVAILYKYFEEELDKFCKMYFSKVSLDVDEDKGYALILCRK